MKCLCLLLRPENNIVSIADAIMTLLYIGGMSHFSNHWGLVCDNVKNFEVVLGSSDIVQANADENPDLFRALKGGGSNFGKSASHPMTFILS
jgi:predicted alternative tryptophan synthase beta-subunit